MKITEFKKIAASTGTVSDIDWDMLVVKLKSPYVSGFTREQFMAMDKDAQTAEKEKSGGAVWGESIDGHRYKASIPYRCALSLDYDEAPADIVSKIENVLQDVEYVIYSTIKSTATAPRVRVIIPTDRLFDQDEHDALGRLICGRIGMQGADKSMLQNPRIMLYPAVLKGQDFIYKYNKKEFFKVDEWLSKYEDWRDISQRPLFDGEKLKIKKIKDDIAQEKATGVPMVLTDPRNKTGVVGAFCESYSISSAIKKFLPDVYEDCGDGRYTFIAGHSKKGVAVFDDMFAYSFHATDPAGYTMCNSYDLVRIHKFGNRDKDKEYSDINRMPSNVAMQAFAKADPIVARALQERMAKKYQVELSKEDRELAVRLGWHQLSCTDEGTAKRVAALVGQTVRYDRNSTKWYCYEDGQWQKQKDDRFLYQYISKVADMTIAAFVDTHTELSLDAQNYQKYAQSNRNKKAVIDELKSVLGINAEDFDADDNSFNVADGYMDINTGEYVEHHPDQLCIMKANAQVNGDIEPRCFQFLEEIFPDPEVYDYMHRLCGYMLGRNNKQKFIILYGELGNNGKSVFSTLLEKAFGSYCKTAITDSILTSRDDGDPERANPSIAMLRGCRVALMHETDYSRVIRSAAVKRLTSNTKIVARYLNENFVEFLPKFTCLLDVNHAPKLQDSGDDSMKKRVRIVPFLRHFTAEEADDSIEEAVQRGDQKWINSFLMWCIDGRQEYLKRGLDNYDGTKSLAESDLPAEMKKVMAEYYESSDDVGEYVLSCLDISHNPTDFVSVKSLYEDYTTWVTGTPRGSNAFSQQVKKRLQQLGVAQSTMRDSDGVQYRGYAGVAFLRK